VSAADRFFYLPSVGLFLLLALLLDVLRQSVHGRTLAYCLVLGTSLIWLTLTIERTGVWRNSFLLWADTARKTPNSDVALNNLGIVLAHQGRPAEARIMYERSLSVATNSYALINLGLLNLREGNTNVARDLLMLGEALDPAQFEIRYARAALEFNLTNYVAAEQYLLALTQQRPLATHLVMRLGAVYMMMAQTNKAIAALRKALGSHKEGAGLYLEIGQLYEYNGEFLLADGIYEQGLSKFPQEPSLLYRRGVTLCNLGKEHEAIKCFTTHLSMCSNNWDAWSNLALAHRALGDLGQAVAYSERAMAAAGTSPEILYNHACLLVAAQREREAFTVLTNAFLRAPRLRQQSLLDQDLRALWPQISNLP
jgi:Tfp pilus assembly protein PilF